jgi:Ca-activated chloride channel family protein
MSFSAVKIFAFSLVLLFTVSFAFGQSRNNTRTTGEFDGTVLPVTISRADGSKEPLKLENLSLYENGIEQKIKNFAYDTSPSKIVLLVDNSQTLQADIDAMKKAAMEFAYEIFDGDQLFVVAYDEKPEIIQEWTDDAKKLEASFGTFRKQGNPYLFDALSITTKEVLAPLMPGTRKAAIVIISDGLDRGSKTSFEKVLAEMQTQNVTLYFLQLPDRTSGAYRRNQPKAREVVKKLVEGTGGLIFSFDESQNAAKIICDELRNNRYLLSYFPTNFSAYDDRRVFLIGPEGTTVRTKSAQPATVK